MRANRNLISPDFSLFSFWALRACVQAVYLWVLVTRFNCTRLATARMWKWRLIAFIFTENVEHFYHDWLKVHMK